MKTPPEAYLIFKEELKKVEAEKARLKAEYEEELKNLLDDMENLREQINSQQQMMKISLDYASKLEKELNQLRDKIEDDKERTKQSFH